MAQGCLNSGNCQSDVQPCSLHWMIVVSDITFALYFGRLTNETGFDNIIGQRGSRTL